MYLLNEFDELKENEKIKMLLNNRLLIEKYHVEKHGYSLSSSTNGPDGIKGNKYLEVKSQCKVGKTKLNGTFIFANASKEVLRKNIKLNPTIIIVGYNSFGDLLYEFSLSFEDIANDFRLKLDNSSRLSSMHFKVIDYKNSLNVLLKPSKEDLIKNKNQLNDKFYNFLDSL